MADNVYTMKKQHKDAEKKVESFIKKNRNVLLCIILVVVVAAVAVTVVVAVKEHSKNKALAEIDNIEYDFTKKSSDLTEDEIAAREENALEALSPYLGRKDVAGVRANYLASEIAFIKKDYEAVISYCRAAAEAGKKSYTAPVVYFNAGVAAEELGKNEDALDFYKKAADAKDFYLGAHALFNVGRLNETLGNYSAAVESYQSLIDLYSGDEYTDLAYSRIVAIRASGLAD